MLSRNHDLFIPCLSEDEYTGADWVAPDWRPMRCTSRPSDQGEPEDPEGYERLTARTRKEKVVECRSCGAESVYARGWCRNCYDRWRYHNLSHAKIRENQKKYKDRIRREKHE